MILKVGRKINEINKSLKYEAKIIFKESKDEYYKKSFYNYDDALDMCNLEYFKIKDKNKYVKTIDLVTNK